MNTIETAVQAIAANISTRQARYDNDERVTDLTAQLDGVKGALFAVATLQMSEAEREAKYNEFNDEADHLREAIAFRQRQLDRSAEFQRVAG